MRGDEWGTKGVSESSRDKQRWSKEAQILTGTSHKHVTSMGTRVIQVRFTYTFKHDSSCLVGGSRSLT